MAMYSSSSSLPLFTSSPRNLSCCSLTFPLHLFSVRSSSLLQFSCNKRRGHLFLGFSQPRHSYLAAATDTSTVPTHSAEDVQLSCDARMDESLFGNNQDVKVDESEMSDQKNVGDVQMVKVCDKLIGVFMVDKPTPTDWRRLLAFSREWDSIRSHFYKRCQEKADTENDPEMKHKLLRLRRKLKEIDDDVQRHDELLEVVKSAPSDIHAIVDKRRKDFTKEFFTHLYTVAQSYYEDLAKQDELANLGSVCIADVQAYDNASEGMQDLNLNELKLQDFLNSPMVDAVSKKIDDLADKKQLDSATMSMLTKSWSGGRGTDMTKDQATDTLYHLYNTTVSNLQRLVPKEVRILKYLLTIDDPEERLSALNDAFSPEGEQQGSGIEWLYTTPQDLHSLGRSIIHAYHFSKEGTVIGHARDLLDPRTMHRLEDLVKLIKDKFL